MTNLFNPVNEEQKAKKEKKDIRIVFLVFVFIFSVIGSKLYPGAGAYVSFAVAVLLLIVLSVSPMTLKPLFLGWLKVAHIIGKFNTMLLLTAMFFLIFLPTGLLMRLFGKDPMRRDCFKGANSYWEKSSLSGLEDKSRYERQF